MVDDVIEDIDPKWQEILSKLTRRMTLEAGRPKIDQMVLHQREELSLYTGDVGRFCTCNEAELSFTFISTLP